MKNKTKFGTIRPLIDEAFNKGEGFTFTPNGVSMKPFIKGGKTNVTIEKYTGNGKKYDIVFYRRSDGQYVMHRIVKILKDSYGVCGDNQWWVEKVYDKDVFAVVTFVSGKKMKGAGYWVYCRALFIRRFIKHVNAYIKKHLCKGEGK